jgi:hypothetical protein
LIQLVRRQWQCLNQKNLVACWLMLQISLLCLIISNTIRKINSNARLLGNISKNH